MKLATFCLSLAACAVSLDPLQAATAAPPVQRTETRAVCTSQWPERRAFFGETHSHTGYSFDAIAYSIKNPPSDAYLYAKGQPIYITDASGSPTRCAQIARPLDWAAITDHSEYLGEVDLCTDTSSPAYNDPECVAARNDPPATANSWLARLTGAQATRPAFCGTGGTLCQTHAVTIWDRIKQAAEEAYDKTSACTFTSFIAYEWTSMPGYNNRHRNVIFRNSTVPTRPISVFDTQNDETLLWSKLTSECVNRAPCEALTIPHNGNLSNGQLYALPTGADLAYATKRAQWEPLSEIHQGKGNSECRTHTGTEDPECGFEQLAHHNLGFETPAARKAKPRTTNDPFAPNAFLRNVLKDGLAKERQLGANPYRFGFAGGTDTHNALPGGADEANYLGLHGSATSGPANLLSQVDLNPGALTVAWATENSRDAIFEALRRRETYATSGTRPTVRLFAGWSFPAGLCDNPDFVKVGYQNGVPMGSTLPTRPSTSQGGVQIAVMAMKDPGSEGAAHLSGGCAVYAPGAPLQRIEIVKGWLDAAGTTHERVYTVAGDAVLDPKATVDPVTCRPAADAGRASLCAVWTDPSFVAGESAFYYARVLENPTCRWSTWTCKSAGFDPFNPATCRAHLAEFSHQSGPGGRPSPYDTYSVCCSTVAGPVVQPTEIPRVIQERAWTSPVWYTPSPAKKAQKVAASPAKKP